MTVTTQTAPKRWGVWNRTSPGSPWKLVVSHPDEREALRLLVGLAADSGVFGDWRVGPVEPIANRPGLFDRPQ